MLTWLVNLWDAIRSSLWFIPAALTLGVIAVSVVMLQVDDYVEMENSPRLSWASTTPESARSTLSLLAGMLLSVTGVVFSITMLTLSQTSSQFGSRLLRTFLNQNITQFTLGVFLAAGIYALLILRTVRSSTDSPSTPHLSVALAVVMAIFSLGLFIYFIHHVAASLQAQTVVTSVVEELNHSIVRVFPESLDDVDRDEEQKRDRKLHTVAEELGPDFVAIDAIYDGYLQAIDYESIMHLACRRNLVIEFLVRPGDFLIRGRPIAHVWPLPAFRSSDRDVVVEAFITGNRRTPRQDVECGVDELAEVAVRALSPGINDPYTAETCIDYLCAALCRLVGRHIPSRYRSDDEGQLRLVVKRVTFDNVLASAFDAIRHYGADSLIVLNRLVEVQRTLFLHIQRPEDRAVLGVHVQKLKRTIESAPFDEQDRRELLQRIRELMPAVPVVDDAASGTA